MNVGIRLFLPCLVSSVNLHLLDPSLSTNEDDKFVTSVIRQLAGNLIAFYF
ncbi:hypothetical protein NIES2098_27670 [Calothrix sp. NIES-2098]|nr:hypothetical protein NIES2098_27670 [Calothrix sp. NIES-2098]